MISSKTLDQSCLRHYRDFSSPSTKTAMLDIPHYSTWSRYNRHYHQLVNTGVRIARRPSLVDESNFPIAESSRDAMKRQAPPNPLTTRQDRPVNNSSNFTVTSNDSSRTSKDTTIHPELTCFDYSSSHVYNLENKNHKVRYRLSTPTSRTSRLLPGSFNHPYCPIQYYAIAIMLCKELDTGIHYMTYAKLPVRFDPPVNVLSTTYAGLLRETDRLWLGNDSFLNRLLNSSQRYRHKHRNSPMYKNYSNPSFVSLSTSSSSSSLVINNSDSGLMASSDVNPDTGNRMTPRLSFISDWWYRLVQNHHAWLPLDRQPSKYSKALDCTLELPRRAFCRGQALPFSVKLVNGAGIRIAMVTIEMKLIRRICMTCSVGETVASDIDFQTTSIFYGDEIDAPETLDGPGMKKNTTTSGLVLTPPTTPPLKPEENNSSSLSSSSSSTSSTSPAARQPFFLFTTREMHFDLSPVANIPQHCPCTIMSELTRDTFELVYDWVVKVKVLEARHGPRLDASLDDNDDQATKYYASRLPSSCGVPSSDYRTHVLEPPKMSIVVGNVACKV
ncbi:unnamed protein product [Absidia cylindrospora]